MTLWGMLPSSNVHTTAWPAWIVTVRGLKAMFLMLDRRPGVGDRHRWLPRRRTCDPPQAASAHESGRQEQRRADDAWAHPARPARLARVSPNRRRGPAARAGSR